jgi:hypothetical protein
MERKSATMHRRAIFLGNAATAFFRAAADRRMPRPPRVGITCCMAAVLLCCTACSTKKKGPKLDLTPVAGIVTLDGKPLSDADVGFYLQGATVEGYYGSAGKTDAEGKYELAAGAAKGAVPGGYKVTVSQYRDANGAPVVIAEGMDLEQLKMQGQAKEMLPPQYSDMEKTELKATVEKGKADGYDFSLKSS